MNRALYLALILLVSTSGCGKKQPVKKAQKRRSAPRRRIVSKRPVPKVVAPVVEEPTGPTVLESIAALTEVGGKIEQDSDKNVVAVDLSNRNVTDAHLEHVKTFTQLKRLQLHTSEITDEGLACLAGLEQLTMLSLAGTAITDQGLSRVEQNENLAVLNLESTGISDAGLDHLGALAKLETLNLNGTQVSDAGMAVLGSLPALQVLALNGTDVSDAGLKELEGLAGLEILTVTNTQISDKGLEHLKGAVQLEVLGLSGTRVTDAGIRCLKGLEKLTYLYLRDTKVADQGLVHLEDLPRLTHLDLSQTEITDLGLRHLRRPPELQAVSIYLTKTSDEQVAELRESLPQCKISHFSSLPPVVNAVQAPQRIWRDSTGKHRIRGRFIAFRDAGVELADPEGATIGPVSLERLSEKDQRYAFLAQQQRWDACKEIDDAPVAVTNPALVLDLNTEEDAPYLKQEVTLPVGATPDNLVLRITELENFKVSSLNDTPLKFGGNSNPEGVQDAAVIAGATRRLNREFIFASKDIKNLKFHVRLTKTGGKHYIVVKVTYRLNSLPKSRDLPLTRARIAHSRKKIEEHLEELKLKYEINTKRIPVLVAGIRSLESTLTGSMIIDARTYTEINKGKGELKARLGAVASYENTIPRRRRNLNELIGYLTAAIDQLSGNATIHYSLLDIPARVVRAEPGKGGDPPEPKEILLATSKPPKKHVSFDVTKIDELKAKVHAATIYIEGPQGLGSGVVTSIRGRKYILTANHVIENQPYVTVVATLDGSRGNISRSAGWHAVFDVASLPLPASMSHLPAMPLLDMIPPVGTDVILSGYPEGVYHPWARGKILNYDRGLTRMLHTAFSEGGSSGGMLITPGGYLCGIHCGVETYTTPDGIEHIKWKFSTPSWLILALVRKHAGY